MAALPRFSFTGWSSQSIAPKINPATVPIAPPPAAIATPPGQLIAQTNAANTNLPAWLQSEVDRLNAQQALRTQMAGAVTGAPAPTQNIGDILQGVAAVTAARGGFNQQVFGMNEAARLQNLIQQRNQLRPTGGFGFNSLLDVPRQLALDRQIEDYQRVNLPVAAGIRPSGWTSPYVNPFRTF